MAMQGARFAEQGLSKPGINSAQFTGVSKEWNTWICRPLAYVNAGNVNIYRFIPIPIPFDETKFLYIDTRKTFLDVFVKLRIVTISFIMSVPTGQIFITFYICAFFSKICRENLSSNKI